MSVAEWIGILGGIAGIIGGLAGFGAYRKAGEANRISNEANSLSKEANDLSKESVEKAQTANSYAREANSLSTVSNRIATEANELAQRAITLEYEPNFRITTSYEQRYWGDNPATLFRAKAINVGRLPVTLEQATFVFPLAPFGFGFGRWAGLNMDDPELPQRVEPGYSYTATTLASQVRDSLKAEQEKGKNEFEIVFTDETGKRHSSGLIQIDTFVQTMDVMETVYKAISRTGLREIPGWEDESES